MDLALVDSAARILVQANHAVALTGAGISTESGVPDFRSPGGIWERYDPTTFFYERFVSHPKDVWNTILDMHRSGGLKLWDAEPNPGHKALAWMETAGILRSVITQNVDNLHQKAGSKQVIEFHGNMLYCRCLCCGKRYDYIESMKIIEHGVPPLCACKGVLKPDAIFFGEAIPSQALKQSFREAQVCDVMLVVGTSAQVEPAASLPRIAKGMSAYLGRVLDLDEPKAPCHVIEINMEETQLTGEISDFIIKGSAGEILKRITQRIQELKTGVS